MAFLIAIYSMCEVHVKLLFYVHIFFLFLRSMFITFNADVSQWWLFGERLCLFKMKYFNLPNNEEKCTWNHYIVFSLRLRLSVGKFILLKMLFPVTLQSNRWKINERIISGRRIYFHKHTVIYLLKSHIGMNLFFHCSLQLHLSIAVIGHTTLVSQSNRNKRMRGRKHVDMF